MSRREDAEIKRNLAELDRLINMYNEDVKNANTYDERITANGNLNYFCGIRDRLLAERRNK